MIYIKNTTDIQTIFIPRNELQKEAYITSTKTYEDGYREGLEDGKEYQKDQLLNLYVTENGEYEREDGWGVVTVDMSVPDCSGAYDEGYNQGYEDGQNSVECPEPTLEYKDVTITNNGTTYLRAEEDGVDGYNLVSINVDVPTEGGSCSLGEEWIILGQNDAGATYELYATDSGYDGFSKVTIEVENFTADCPMSEIWTADQLSNRIVNDNISGGEEYVRGTITHIDEVSTRYGNATYIIDDVFKVYRGKWFYGEPFYEENQIQVGDWVIVKGTTQNYNGQAQFKAGSQVAEHKRCEGGGNCDDAYNGGYQDGYGQGHNDGYGQGYNDGQANCGGEGGSCNLINPIIFSETEGNTVNADSVEIPTFLYYGNQYYNVWALNMAEYEEFKIQIRFKPTNDDSVTGEPLNVFGCEDTDWDNTTFGVRIYSGNVYFRMSGYDVALPLSLYEWYDVEMGYNAERRWVIVNGQTIMDDAHAWFNKPNQNLMIGAINSGGNAFRPFYGYITAAYIIANGSQVWLLPKEEGHMDVYWNDRSNPWVSIGGENNAQFETEWISGDGMKTFTWLGKRISCPSVQEEALLYDTIAFSYTVDGWRNHNFIRDNMTNDCDDRPLDCLLLRNRYGECTVMTKLDICSGNARLENGWGGGSIIYSLKSNTITKFSNSSINSYHLKSIDTGFAQLEENAIINCNALTDIKVTILNNDLSYQFATNCFNGLPTEGTITIDKNVGVTLTDDEITSFFRTIVGEGWTITIE